MKREPTTKTLNVIVVSDERSPVRRFQLRPDLLKRALAGAGALLLGLSVALVDYVRLRVQAVDVDRLRAQTTAQQATVESVQSSLEDLEGELARLREFERKVRVIANLPNSQTPPTGGPENGGQGGGGPEFGDLVAPPALDFVKSYVTPLAQIDWAFLDGLYAEMTAQGVEALKRVGADPNQITRELSADMRYVGQGRELTVALPEELLASRDPELLVKVFYADYQRLYSRCLTDVPVEALSWRLVVRAPAPKVSLAHRAADGASLANARKKPRRVYYYDIQDFVETQVYDHDRLMPGALIEGPAIIEQRASTAVAGPGDRVTSDAYLNLTIELAGSHAAKGA